MENLKCQLLKVTFLDELGKATEQWGMVVIVSRNAVLFFFFAEVGFYSFYFIIVTEI